MAKLILLLLVSICLSSCQAADVQPLPVRATASPAATPLPTPSDRIPDAADDILVPWKQTIGATVYRWNGADLFVRRRQAHEVGIFSKAARQYRSSFQKSGGKCLLDSYFTPSAVVGNLLSYEHESSFGGDRCGVMSGEWSYATVDVANSTRFLDLRDYFTDEQLLEGFLANPQLSSDIEKAIADKKLNARPVSLNELSQFLTRYDYQLFDGNSYFEDDYLTRFAFHHVEGAMISIRVSATSTSNAGRAIHDYAAILLPIPNKLRDSLLKASAGDEGFLMKNAPTKVGTKAATIELMF